MSVAELMDDSEDIAATLQPQPPGNLTVVVRHEPEAASWRLVMTCAGTDTPSFGA
jgi:hypothetical protein